MGSEAFQGLASALKCMVYPEGPDSPEGSSKTLNPLKGRKDRLSTSGLVSVLTASEALKDQWGPFGPLRTSKARKGLKRLREP